MKFITEPAKITTIISILVLHLNWLSFLWKNADREIHTAYWQIKTGIHGILPVR